jgi:hypothetical protein
MAKKLIYNYEFTPGGANAGVIKFKGRHPQRTLLLVTNVTRSTIIYNFAGSGFGGTVTYDAENDESTLTLESDTSTHNSADELQIFLDIREDKVDFSETFTDPVSKLRVSNPQNLIDTDFEYGLQPTKWETVELVNNIPSFFASNESYAIGDVTSVITSQGSKDVTVSTLEPHGLSVGSPFEIQGLSQKTAEGKYLVSNVSSTTTFSYNAKKKQTATVDVSGSYTIVTPGQFYESADIGVSGGINTNESTRSSLEITTDYTHGFENGSSVYLTNTYGNEAYVVDDGTATAGDGRPFIDFAQTVNTTIDLDETQIVTREMNSTYFFEFFSTTVNISGNKILWPNSNLRVGDVLLYLTAPYDTAIGGLTRQEFYYVKTVDSTGITLCETTNGAYTTNSTITLSSAGTYAYGPHSLHLAYELGRLRKDRRSYYQYAYSRNQQTFSGSGWDLRNFASTYGLGGTSPDKVMFIDRNTSSGNFGSWTTGAVYASYNDTNFTMGKSSVGIVDDSEFMENFARYEAYSMFNVPQQSFQSYMRFYNNSASYYSSVDRTLSNDNAYMILLKRNTESETFFKLNHGLSTGDSLTLTTQSGSDIQYTLRTSNNWTIDGSLSTVASGSSGTVTVVDPNRFKLDFISGYTSYGQDKKLTHIRGQYQLSGTFGNDKKNSIYVGSNNLTDNQKLTVSTTSTYPTTSTGIVTPTPNTIGSVYYATKTWVGGKVTAAGSDHGKLFFNSVNYYQPIQSSRVVDNTYGQQWFYIQHLRNSYSRLYTSSMGYIGQWNHSHGVSPIPSNESARDVFYGNSLFRNKGFYYMASDWQYNTSSDYFIFVEQIPDISDYNNTRIVQHHSQIYGYNYSNASKYSYQTPNRQHTAWKTISPGWRYMYAYRYVVPNSQYQGLMSVSLILDNSQFPMYQPNQNYASWYTTNTSYPWAGTQNYYGGQRYHVNILVPQKFGTVASNLYPTNQTAAETMVDSLASAITANISYPSFNAPPTTTTAYAERVDDNRIRLLGQADGETFRFTSSGTDLTMSTDLQRGGVDGEYIITNNTPNQFRTIAAYKINGREISVAFGNISSAEFTSTAHKLLNGSKVTYTEEGGASVAELTSGNEYYVHVTGPDTFKLSNTSTEAINGITIAFTDPTSGSITIGVKNISSRQEDGTITLTAGESKVIGTDTTFTQYFKPGDTLVIKNGGTTPATFEEYIVSVVTDDAELYVQNPPVTTISNTQFYIDTKVYVKPDGSSQHRPFDGGVEINAGSSPNSSIVRQTRKYFRYQSGKGIQCSLAINFNPSRLVNTVTGLNNAALPVKTKEVILTNVGTLVYNLYGEDRFGTVIGDNKTITVVKGDTLRLVVSAAGHPTWIQSAARGSGTGPSNAVTTGVTNNGATSGTIIWDTTNVTAGTYYYQCANHYVMQGQIIIEDTPSANSLVTISTQEPHGLNRGNTVKIAGSDQSEYNGTFDIVDADDFSFTYECSDSGTARNLTTGTPSGLLNYNPGNYSNAAIRCGLFDYQNGFFFEYDGTDLYAVRRSSVQQISGRSSVVSGSNVVTGTDTAYSRQLSVGDMVVIRGSSYRVTAIGSDTNIHIQPAYKGINSTDAVVTKTVDTKVSQSNWNIDKADGTGPSGFDLDITKIQMAYLDYSWYGAGKIRFGFKDTHGHVKYMHEFIHNNQLDEAYMRSGNIPGRYEIENTGGEVGFIPALFHWGTSVMMDGGFDDDKAYLFTASSNDLTFTNGDSNSITTVANSSLIWNYNYGERRFYWYVKIPFATADAGNFSTGVELYTAGQELNGEKVDYTDYADGNFNVYIFVAETRRYTEPVIYPSVTNGTAVSIGAPASGPVTDAVDLTQDIPLISIRLAPSVDNNLTGALGARDIINRMQLQLKQLGITVTHDCTVDLILNGAISTREFDKVQAPSLSELVRHQSGDRIIGGTKVFALRASGGQGNTTSVTEDFDLTEITDLGNSILGGDGVFPNGPDMLTIALVPNDTSLINATTPLKVSSRITWTESQA